MRFFPIPLVFFVTVGCFGQTTYSAYEENRFHELNMEWAAARMYNSSSYYRGVIDSIDLFLKDYPHSVYKSGLLQYKLDLFSAVSSDRQAVGAIADSILAADAGLMSTLGIAEIFIRKNIDPVRGASMIRGILPHLTVPSQRYSALTFLASAEIAAGDHGSARRHLLEAITVDSTRYEAYYQYVALLRSREESSEARTVVQQIRELEKSHLLHYGAESGTGPNLFKELSFLRFTTMSGEEVSMSAYSDKVTVLNIFAFWCGSCVPELQILHSLSREFPEAEFLYVNGSGPLGGDPFTVTKKFLPQPEFAVLHQKEVLFPEEAFYDSVTITGVPTTLFIDRNGTVRFEYRGYVEGGETLFRKNLRQLMEGKGKP